MMFSFTVSPGKIRRPSGTWEMPMRTISSGDNVSMRLPSNQTSPLVGLIKLEIVRRVVLFPAPLAPSSVTISPCSTCRLTPRSASTLP
jgi:hypothetical protein